MDLFAYKIIPVVVLQNPEDARPVGEALVAGGLPIAEVTFRTEAAAECVSIMSEIEGLTVGVGTVVALPQIELAVEAGAQFFVSPGLRPELIREARLAGKPILPGAVTPSEIMEALSLGITTVKFFPANLYGGVAGIKALAAPFTSMRFVPTGGISPANITEYLSLSCVAALGGSWMIPPALVAAGDFEGITKLCRQAVELAAAAV
ncbi:MAG: bifunctional 4-hydroxy-2-oxoglutarate aldolase/2-dehydro-3-deoxy-phosphogluconate aldolase [Propionibacteriaceae bacterium]|jgi:2-dehydro-3-deoxyphosphogluconate aldolase/(4S)-4-hydroxy-2-oxoglutarate aldolase|nr:bifunctional 4-hydroxy-2-oxoglutarate aldolase/2-dehydro-3-deoxy-phosphogluconate aldolase [Propionibacteriaceae bacterium]